MSEFRFGFAALAGVPNVGKSTLINRLMGKKISIISRRPQTTRHRILGIYTADDFQIAMVDMPGLEPRPRSGLDRVIRKTAVSSMSDVDLILFMIDSRGWHDAPRQAFELVRGMNLPVLLIINKIDCLDDKAKLLPLIEESNNLHPFSEIIPISARKLPDDKAFCSIVAQHLPLCAPGFPEEMTTDRSDRFQASELVREQTYLLLGQELPYSISAETTRFEVDGKGTLCVDVTLWVEKPGQKSIVIGKQGSMLKRIGSGARRQMEKAFSRSVYLSLWVKVKKGWPDRDTQLKSFGYIES
ncbi:MAG: GTPase Era [Gammaproteobacteria bacterium]|nr:GTPase Era [Gammaproteobacteria bacterium]MYD75713.1 GTPase Era [Gammaproteobacteria bacterium]MYJ52540.1 GTPase Era [Gammaproteobacteria bacterium]